MWGTDFGSRVFFDETFQFVLCPTHQTSSETRRPTQRTSSEHLCPHFGLAPRFLVWAPHFRSAYGGGGAGDGGSNLLTLRYLHYNDVGLAPNVITCYDMLLATNKLIN